MQLSCGLEIGAIRPGSEQPRAQKAAHGRHFGRFACPSKEPVCKFAWMNSVADARDSTTESGLGKKADVRSRSVRVRNLPDGTQEGLLQQALEKIAKVKRVEVFVDLKEAVVELDSAAVSQQCPLPRYLTPKWNLDFNRKPEN
jgi:hypothetical protein